MSSGAPSFTLPPTANVLLASPSIGPSVCTASLRLPITASPARSVSPVRSLPLPFEAPFTVQTSPVHSGIEIMPQPPRSSVVAVPTAPLACTPSLTERALRSQRRDAMRALHDVAATSSPSPVRLHDTSLADSGFGAQTENSQMQPLTPRQEIPVHTYNNSAPASRATIHVAYHPPFTVRVTPRVFTPLAALRASRSTMSTTPSTAPSTKPTFGTAAQISTRTGSPPPSTSGPLLDFSPMGSADLRASTGSRTGRTPGFRPKAPMPRTALTVNGGPPPHLKHWAPVWDTLTAQQRADVARPSLHEVKEGLARTQVSENSTATDPDRHAIDFGTAERERVAGPLISKLTVLRGHRATAHTELLECQERVTAIQTQERSTAAALTAEKRRHAFFLSGFSDPPPASANTVTLVAPPVPQPTAVGVSTVPTAAAVTRSSDSTAPALTGLLAPPVGTLPARHAMQSPAPRESHDSSSSPLWSVVARRQPQPNKRPATRMAGYLELPVSKFMFKNKAFPSELRAPIKDHATEVHETPFDFTGKRYRLHRSLALATQDRTPLDERVVNATLRLRDLLDTACCTIDGEQWLLDTLQKVEMDRASRTESSSASDSSAPTGQRRREKPSSGRETQNGQPSLARIATPRRTPGGRNATDGK